MLDHPIISPRHGGALRAASARYGIAPEDWLDLSTGINPHRYPVVEPAGAGLDRLPDPASLAALIETARTAYGAPSDAALAAVPGTDLALRLLPLLAPAGPVAILGPTYSGHAEAWRDAGRIVSLVPTLADLPPGCRILVVVNPNNPDGRIVQPRVLIETAQRLALDGGLLVVDEAFADVAPEASVIPRLQGEPVVVLRSFGKFYGLAGLRLGFAVGDAEIVARLGRLLGDWPVSGPAIAVGSRALADAEWRAVARTGLERGRELLAAMLEAAGLSLVGGTDLFQLADAPDAKGLHEALARQGVWTRIFDDQPGRIRFGLPADDRFDRLAAALARC
jgi:cobalamin biosynthetic protein CobC